MGNGSISAEKNIASKDSKKVKMKTSVESSEQDIPKTFSQASRGSRLLNSPHIGTPSFIIGSARRYTSRDLTDLWLPSEGTMRSQDLVVEEKSSTRLIR